MAADRSQSLYPDRVTPFLDSSELREAVYPVNDGFDHDFTRLGMIGEDVGLLDGVIFRKIAKSPLHERADCYGDHQTQNYFG